ncbi:MAG: M48 family metalloprotease, partial [Planctomycetes bacterium]|nr:M48 family metalloprotease [Planctomycetota bacterium]
MRLISPRGLWARIVLLTIGLVTVFGPYRVGANAEDAPPAEVRREPGRISFTDRQRQVIDEAAMGSLRAIRSPARAEAYGDVVEWLVARTPLPEEEFRRRAAARDAEVVRTFSTADAPQAAEAIFAKLVDTLPERMRPQRDRFALVVVEDSPKDSFTTGAGRVYLDKEFLESTLADRQSGAEQVAMATAHELGHVCRGHVRHKFQRQWLEEEIGRDIDASRRVDRKQTSKTVVRSAGMLLESLYTPDEDFEADLFALHLCRNAGFDLEDCLDVFRRQAVRDDTDPPLAAGRLARLRVELDGAGYADSNGLFRFDPQSKTLKRAADGSVPQRA